MYIRAASLFLLLTFASVPAYAQGRTGNVAPGVSFQALLSELEALKARVAKLESGEIDAADLAGTYVIHGLGIELHGGFPAQMGSETTVGTVTLHADGTGTGSGKDARYDLRQGFPWSLAYSESPFSGSFTWSVVNGTLVVPAEDPEDEDLVLTIGAGGRVLIAGGTTPGGIGWSNLFLLVRLPNQ